MRTPSKSAADLAQYLHRRLEYLQDCNAEVERGLSDDKIELARQVSDGECGDKDPVVGKRNFYLDCVVGNTFRYVMLVGICSFLEEAIKAISRLLIDDYDTRRKGKGNWLKKHVRLLSEHADMDVAPLQTDLDRFQDVITIRNCIVHAWGKISNASNPEFVQEVVQRVDTANTVKDGYVFLGDQVVPDALWAAQNIADTILSCKFDVSIT